MYMHARHDRYTNMRAQSICRLRCLQPDTTFLLCQLYQLSSGWSSGYAENVWWNSDFNKAHGMGRINYGDLLNHILGRVCQEGKKKKQFDPSQASRESFFFY